LSAIAHTSSRTVAGLFLARFAIIAAARSPIAVA